jgi:hypothetical protein
MMPCSSAHILKVETVGSSETSTTYRPNYMVSHTTEIYNLNILPWKLLICLLMGLNGRMLTSTWTFKPYTWNVLLILFHQCLDPPNHLLPSYPQTRTWCTLYLVPHVLHAVPTSVLLIGSPEQNVVRTNEAWHCVIFSSLTLLPLYWTQMFPAHHSQILPICVLPLCYIRIHT